MILRKVDRVFDLVNRDLKVKNFVCVLYFNMIGEKIVNKKLLAAIISGSMLAAPPLAVEAEKVNSSKKSSNATSKVKKIVIGAGIVGTSIAGAVLVARELIQGQSPVSNWLQKEGKSFVQTLKMLLSEPVLNQLPENPEVVAQVLDNMPNDAALDRSHKRPLGLKQKQKIIPDAKLVPNQSQKDLDDLTQKFREAPVEKVEQLQKAIQTLMEETKSDEKLKLLKGILQILQILQMQKELETCVLKLPQLPQPQKEVESMILEQSKEKKENQAETENAIAGVQSATEESGETIARMGKNMEEKSTTEPTKEIEIYRSKLPQLSQPQKEVNPPASDLVTNDKIKQKFSQLLGSLQQITKEEKEKHQAEMGNAIAGMENATENLEKAIAGMEEKKKKAKAEMEEEEKKEQTNWEKALGKVREELQVQVCDSTKNLPTEESTTEPTMESIMKKVEFDLIDDPNDIINAIKLMESKDGEKSEEEIAKERREEAVKKILEMREEAVKKIKEIPESVEIPKLLIEDSKQAEGLTSAVLELKNLINYKFKYTSYTSNSLPDLIVQMGELGDDSMRDEIVINYISCNLTMILEQASDDKWKDILKILKEIRRRTQSSLIKQMKFSSQELIEKLTQTDKNLQRLDAKLKQSSDSIKIGEKWIDIADLLEEIDKCYQESLPKRLGNPLEELEEESEEKLKEGSKEESEEELKIGQELEKILKQGVVQANKDLPELNSKLKQIYNTKEYNTKEYKLLKNKILRIIENLQQAETYIPNVEDKQHDFKNADEKFNAIAPIKDNVVEAMETVRELILVPTEELAEKSIQVISDKLVPITKNIENMKNMENMENILSRANNNKQKLEKQLEQAKKDLQVLTQLSDVKKLGQARKNVLLLSQSLSLVDNNEQKEKINIWLKLEELIGISTSELTEVKFALIEGQDIEKNATKLVNSLKEAQKCAQNLNQLVIGEELQLHHKLLLDEQQIKNELKKVKIDKKVRVKAIALNLAIALASKQEVRRNTRILEHIVALILESVNKKDRDMIIEKILECVPEKEIRMKRLKQIHTEMLDCEQEGKLAAKFYRLKYTPEEDNKKSEEEKEKEAEKAMAVMEAEMQILMQKLMLVHARVRALSLAEGLKQKLLSGQSKQKPLNEESEAEELEQKLLNEESKQKRIKLLQGMQSEINTLKHELEKELEYVPEQVQEYVRNKIREPIRIVECELKRLLGLNKKRENALTLALALTQELKQKFESLKDKKDEKSDQNTKAQLILSQTEGLEKELLQQLNQSVSVSQGMTPAVEDLWTKLSNEIKNFTLKDGTNKNQVNIKIRAQQLGEQLGKALKSGGKLDMVSVLAAKRALLLIPKLKPLLIRLPNDKLNAMTLNINNLKNELKQSMKLVPTLMVEQALVQAQELVQKLNVGPKLNVSQKIDDLRKELDQVLTPALELSSTEGLNQNQEQIQEPTEKLNPEELKKQMSETTQAIEQVKKLEQGLKDDLNSPLARVLDYTHVLERKFELMIKLVGLINKGSVEETVEEIVALQQALSNNLKYEQDQMQDQMQNLEQEMMQALLKELSKKLFEGLSKELIQKLTQKLTPKQIQDLIQDLTSDQIQKLTQGQRNILLKNQSLELKLQQLQDLIQNLTQDLTQELVQNLAQELSQKLSGELLMQELMQKLTLKQMFDITRVLTFDQIQKLTQEQMKNQTQNLTLDQIQKLIENLTQDLTSDQTQKLTQSLKQKLEQQLIRNLTQELRQILTQESTQISMQTLTQEQIKTRIESLMKPLAKNLTEEQKIQNLILELAQTLVQDIRGQGLTQEQMQTLIQEQMQNKIKGLIQPLTQILTEEQMENKIQDLILELAQALAQGIGGKGLTQEQLGNKTKGLIKKLLEELSTELTKKLTQNLTQNQIQAITPKLVQGLTKCLIQKLTQNLTQSLTQDQVLNLIQGLTKVLQEKLPQGGNGIQKKLINLKNDLKIEIEQAKLIVQELKQKENSNTAGESVRKYSPNQYQFYTAYRGLNQKCDLSEQSMDASALVRAIPKKIKELEAQKSTDALTQLQIDKLYDELQRAKTQERELDQLIAFANGNLTKKQTRLLDKIIQRYPD